ncbi:THUMP-like domain-containing protein [Demequina sp.]|uniref:THUMP-like domain-containing protein n=1 Tax=Demequina sp. TaxID=2050685 RepID=UPI003D11CDE0
MDAIAARLAMSAECRALADAIGEYDAKGALAVGQRLRAEGARAELVAAALTQARLRSAATAKFGEFAAGMAFSQEGLEQATRLTVAALHARRYKEAGIERVADLTCGLGADAMAMAALGLGVVAFEKDEATAVLADHNLRHWPDAVVVHAESLSVVRDVEVDGIFADPARRSGAGRRHSPSDYLPPLDSVLGLRDQFPALGLKLGPGVPHEALPSDAECEWVSVDGDVVEVGVWCGPLARRVGHSALVIRHGVAHELAGDLHRGEVRPLGEFVAEPDGAVIRAGLVGALADELGAGLLDQTIAYLTADEAVESPFARCFRVEEVLPLDVKKVASALRARGVGTVEVKKRGVDVVPEVLRKQLKLRGDGSATVILTRVAGKRVAMLAQPV